ncbi:MAG: glycosyltransferase [Thermoproteus sp.]
MARRLVSVVVPTRNSAATLGLTLRSLGRQTYRELEVIVVDNFSVDGTPDIARRFGARVYSYGPERTAQMNFGARVARGDVLYFTNSDFWISPRVVEECVEKIAEGFDAVVVPNISNPRRGLVARARYFERLSYLGSGVYEAARCMRREIFFKIGGFDESLYSNEDYDLHKRIVASGARVGYINAFEIHIDEYTFRDLVLKSLYYGRNTVAYFRKWRDPLHMSPVRPTFFSRRYLSYMGRRWPLGIYFVIGLKLVQYFAAGVGAVLGLSPDPYRKISRRSR